MIKVMRSVQVRSSKSVEVRQWVQEMVAYVNKRRPDAHAQGFEQIMGDSGRIYWTVDFPTLAAMEEHDTSIGQDAEWKQIVAKSYELFVDGSVNDIMLVA